MEILNSIITWAMKRRIDQINHFKKNPIEVQEGILNNLLLTARNTEYGRKYGFSYIRNRQEFTQQVPIVNYEELFPYIERLMKGEQKLLWPTEVKWFAKSSGTTNARSKFIPVTTEALEDCHFKGGKDLLSIYVNNYPETKLFAGKGLGIGGSHQINQFDKQGESYYGDVSAVIMQNLPFWVQITRTPSLEVALMDEWESKIDKMAQITSKENVTNLAGVPTWTIILLERILELTGKSHIHEVWPNLEVFVHGAVAFGPYKSVFKKLIPSTKMRYLETYNASEGFFGIQDQPNSDEMLLMLDYGIFYEFIPAEENGSDNPKVIALHEVEIGKNYAMLISTNAGLWRYSIGDTIKFTSLEPFRIKISGRTKHFMNAFGEEVIVENAEQAVTHAATETNASIANFTAAPKYFSEGKRASHEWVIEFDQQPEDLDLFTRLMDQKLREINSDYDAKRYKDMALEMPKVYMAPVGTFYKWMKSRGKLGGQNKVPRLSNNRDYIDDLLVMLE
jgi:hypothetical protein